MLLTKVEAILHNLNRVLEHGVASNALDSAFSSHILVGYCTKGFSAMRSISSVSVVFLFYPFQLTNSCRALRSSLKHINRTSNGANTFSSLYKDWSTFALVTD